MPRALCLMLRLALGLFTLAQSAAASPKLADAADAHALLQQYRQELDQFRAEFGGTRPLPDVPFFQFGMGGRAKYLFKEGELLEVPSGKTWRRWEAAQIVILPSEWSVLITTRKGDRVRLFEDETAVWLEEQERTEAVPGTLAPVRLPRFSEHRYPAILRTLHHEILINIVAGQPVPNLHVYPKAWYRDGAMMAMCLKETGNLPLIRDWILGLREVFDRNNGGETEADNPGQVLYLISLVSNADHPLVPAVLDALKRFEVAGDRGPYIKGRSDFAEHPVYQTKWAKLGLRALGLPDPYVIPAIRDSYSSLFWMDFRDQHVPGGEAADRALYPYLGWATDHFKGTRLSPISNRDYPLTWETQASQARYPGMRPIDPRFEQDKTAAPHTWHAAEIFLYLLDRRTRPAL